MLFCNVFYLRVLSSSLTIVKLKGVESTDHSESKKRCCKCGLKVATPQTSETQAPTADSMGQGSGSDLQTVASEDGTGKPEVSLSCCTCFVAGCLKLSY